MYKMIVHLAGEISLLESDMNKAAEEGFTFAAIYESNARIIVVMEKKPVAKVGRPKKESNGE